MSNALTKEVTFHHSDRVPEGLLAVRAGCPAVLAQDLSDVLIDFLKKKQEEGVEKRPTSDDCFVYSLLLDMVSSLQASAYQR